MPSKRSSSRSQSRSKSRSRSRSSRASSSKSRSRSRSRSATPFDKNRLHISDIGRSVSKRDLEHIFEKYGRLIEVWLSRTVPAFAFVVFKNDDDAAEACRGTDGMSIHGGRIRVSFARPRAYERKRAGPISALRCYSCNRKGHFSRDCPESTYGYRRPSRYSPHRRGGRSPLTRRYHSRDRYDRSRSRSRDRTSRRRHRSRSRSRRSRSREEKRSKRDSSPPKRNRSGSSPPMRSKSGSANRDENREIAVVGSPGSRD